MDAKTSKDSDDPKAVLKEVYEQHAADLYRYALMILAEHGAAEDAVQQVFMKAVKMGKRLPKLVTSKDYLRTAVRNQCYKVIKKRKRRRDVETTYRSKPILEKTGGELIPEDEQEILEKAIKKLPAEQREVLHMKVYEGMTFQEIGKLIGESMNTAASRYRYALDKLREMLTLSNQFEENYYE